MTLTPPIADPFGLVGTMLAGKYRIDAVVQETEMSVVYRAAHQLWRRDVAIKAFKAQSLGDDARRSLLESFVREGAIMAELSERTAAVCQARDVASVLTPRGDWVPYMVLEWLDGEPLDCVLERERAEGLPPRSVARAMRMLEPIARALTVAHERGIVHCDVKPGNICVLEDSAGGSATPSKLYDFGIATSFHGVASAHADAPLAVAFTPAYAAPEQYAADPRAIGPWTDVFALALVFLEVLTGKDALTGDTLEELRARACDPGSRPTPRAHGVRVGDGIERVLARALALKPEDRFAHAGEFWSALRHAATERGREATIPFLLVRPRRAARGRWLLSAFAVGGGCAAYTMLTHWAHLSHIVGLLR